MRVIECLFVGLVVVAGGGLAIVAAAYLVGSPIYRLYEDEWPWNAGEDGIFSIVVGAGVLGVLAVAITVGEAVCGK